MGPQGQAERARWQTLWLEKAKENDFKGPRMDPSCLVLASCVSAGGVCVLAETAAAGPAAEAEPCRAFLSFSRNASCAAATLLGPGGAGCSTPPGVYG